MPSSLFDTSASSAGWFTAWCDGGSRGNPGPAGYGAVIQNPEGQTVARLSQFLGMQTNNFAEYSGLLAVLEWALANGAQRLKVISDSELMVNQMKGRYKVASPILRPLWEEARGRAKRFEAFEITHTLRGGNKEADRLANDAMDKGMGKSGGASGVSGVSRPASHQASGSAGQQSGLPAQPKHGVPPVPILGPGKAQPQRQVLEGYVKNGVVHILEGELPDGIFVKIIRE
jgi:ribonuclease HI